MNNQQHSFDFNGKGEDASTHFPVPEGYFDTLPDSIMMKVKSETSFQVENHVSESTQDDTNPVIRLIYYAVSVAAVFLVTIGVSNYFNDGTTSLANSITKTDIIESGLLNDIDETILTEQISIEDEDVVELTNADKKEIEDYLIENNSDLSIIYNEL